MRAFAKKEKDFNIFESGFCKRGKIRIDFFVTGDQRVHATTLDDVHQV